MSLVLYARTQKAYWKIFWAQPAAVRLSGSARGQAPGGEEAVELGCIRTYSAFARMPHWKKRGRALSAAPLLPTSLLGRFSFRNRHLRRTPAPRPHERDLGARHHLRRVLDLVPILHRHCCVRTTLGAAWRDPGPVRCARRKRATLRNPSSPLGELGAHSRANRRYTGA